MPIEETDTVIINNDVAADHHSFVVSIATIYMFGSKSDHSLSDLIL